MHIVVSEGKLPSLTCKLNCHLLTLLPPVVVPLARDLLAGSVPLNHRLSRYNRPRRDFFKYFLEQVYFFLRFRQRFDPPVSDGAR